MQEASNGTTNEHARTGTMAANELGGYEKQRKSPYRKPVGSLHGIGEKNGAQD